MQISTYVVSKHPYIGNGGGSIPFPRDIFPKSICELCSECLYHVFWGQKVCEKKRDVIYSAIVNFFSGLTPWSLQIKKRRLRDVYFLMLIFWLFSFWLINQPICKILGSNPKSELGGSLRNTSSKLEVWFCEIFTQLLSECMNFKPLCTLEKWCFLDQHSGLVNTKDKNVAS